MVIYNALGIPSNEEWDSQKESWIKLQKEAPVVSEFTPLTIKALYIIGIIYSACESIDILLHSSKFISTTFFPSFTIYASIMDLLGRCIRGSNSFRETHENVKAGFQRLAKPDYDYYHELNENTIILSTKLPWGPINSVYTIQQLISLRNYSAHGQADSKELPAYDYGILNEIPPLLGKAPHNYLQGLIEDIRICINLSKSSITPYRTRPIIDIISKCHRSGDTFPSDVEKTFGAYNWVPDYIEYKKYFGPTMRCNRPPIRSLGGRLWPSAWCFRWYALRRRNQYN